MEDRDAGLEVCPIVRIIPLLLAVSLITSPAQAQYSGGQGTAEDPYLIATAADLIAFGDAPEDYDKHLTSFGTC